MTICLGKTIIQILAKEGAWSSEAGETLIVADELLQNDPYAEIERLRTQVLNLRALALNLASELEDEIEARYAKTKDHPGMASQYERDMHTVRQARYILDGEKR